MAYLPKHVGGAEIAIKEITDRVVSPDFEFHMIANRYDDTLPETEWIGNVLVHRIGMTEHNPSITDLRKWPLRLQKFLFQIQAAFKAQRLHKTYGYVGIWAMMAHSCGIPAVLFRLRNPRIKYALTLQEGDPPEKIERAMLPFWPLFSRAFKTPTVIQTISTFLASWAKRRGARCAIEVIPNGVDIAHFAQPYDKEKIAKANEAIGRGRDEVWLVTTSRLVYKNAIDDVITALSRLPVHIKFAILGVGPEEKKLREQVETLGLQSRVSFVGHVGHDVLPSYLQACDIFVRPSRSEGMGNSFIEAMVSAIPVIGTHEGGISDFLFDETHNPGKQPTGWVVRKNSPEDIANAVLDILEKPEHTEEVLRNARGMVHERFSWDNIAQQMYERVFTPILRDW